VSIRNWTQVFRNCTQGTRNRIKTTNSHIVTYWAYFIQISNECQIFTQMVIFSHIEHISHKYPMKVKFHTNGHIFTHWAHFTQISNENLTFTHWACFTQLFCYFPLLSWFFEILDFFMMVVAQVWSFIGRWYSWLDHRDDKRRNLIKLIKLFLINDILDSDDSSFF
jgi:hypothetical protein